MARFAKRNHTPSGYTVVCCEPGDSRLDDFMLRREYYRMGPTYRFPGVLGLAVVVYLLVSLFGALHAGAAREVRVGIYDYKPLVFSGESGKPAGVFVEVVEDAAAANGWQITYVPGTWQENLDRLKAGEIDLLPGMAQRSPRTADFDLSAQPVVSSWGQIYAPNGSPITTFLDLHDKRVAGLRGDGALIVFDDQAVAFGVRPQVVVADSIAEAFALVAAGRAEAVASERIAGLNYQIEYGLTTTPVMFSPSSLGFGTTKGRNADLLQALDRNVEAGLADPNSRFAHISQQWLEVPTRTEIPGGLLWVIGIGLAALALLIGGVLYLRYLVWRQTRELAQQNASLRAEAAERAKAEEATARERDLLRSFMDAAPDPTYLKDASGRFTRANSACARTLGLASSDELIGKTDFDLYQPEVARSTRADEQEIMRTGVPVVAKLEQGIRPNGRSVILESSKVPLYDPDGNSVGIAGISRDVTRQHLAEEALRESETKYRALVEGAGDAIYAQDLAGRFTLANAAAATRFGRPVSEIVGRLPAEVLAAETARNMEQDHRQVLEGGAAVEAEREATFDWGTAIVQVRRTPIRDDAGQVVGVVTVSRDVTAQREAEAKLAESEAQFTAMAESTQDLIWMVDPVKFGLLTFNSGLRNYFARTRNLAIQPEMTPHEMVGPSSGAFFCGLYERALREGPFVHEYSVLVGGPLSLSFSVSPVELDGRVIGVSVFGRDVTAQRQAEAKLAESEAYLSAMVESTQDMIWSVDPERFGLLTYNSGLRDYFARDRGIAIQPGMTPQELVPPDSVDLWCGLYERALREGPFAQEYGVVTGTRVLSLSLSPIKRDRQVLGVSVFGRDVTVQRQAERALRLSDAKFATAFKASPDAMAIARLSDGLLVEVNDGFSMATGYTRADALGKTTRDLGLWAGETGWPRGADTLRASSSIQGLEVDFRRKDGSTFPGLVSAAPFEIEGVAHLFSVVRDITERKVLEENLRRQSTRLEILSEIDHAILAAGTSGEIVQAALTRIRQLVPYDAATVLATTPDDRGLLVIAEVESEVPRHSAGTFIPWERANVDDLRAGNARVVDDLRTVASLSPTAALIRESGYRALLHVPLLVELRFVGFVSFTSRQTGAFTAEHVAVARGIANQLAVAIQQARLREQIGRHAEELEQSVAERTSQLQEANAELDSFSHSVSHDLRAPLRALRGYSQILREDRAELTDEEIGQFVERIDNSAKRMDSLVKDLLAFSRVSRTELTLTALNLGQIVPEAIGQNEATLARKGASVETVGEFPNVRGHRTTVMQAIANLVDNAVKYVGPGVTPEVRIHAETRADRVRLWVADNGIGIDPEHQARIFAAFERLHGIDEYPGTGIGLSIVKKGIERMGGTVGVESALGRGSRFWIELPSA